MKNFLQNIIEESEWVVSQANHVHIKEDAIDALANQLVAQGIERPDFRDIAYRSWKTSGELANYCLVLEALNFLTWQVDGKSKWRYQRDGEWFEGWYGWVYALDDILIRNPQWMRFENLQSLTIEELTGELGGKGTLQLMDDRVVGLQEIGAVMAVTETGHFYEVMKKCDMNASTIVQWFSDNVRHFNDCATYDGKHIGFYKRAQHFCVMYWGLAGLASFDRLRGVEDLTILPDQKIPQILRHFGILEYSSQLATKIDSGDVLLSKSNEEIEIRAASIIAGELLRKACEKRGVSLLSLELDVNLWILSHNQHSMKPSHRTVSWAY